MNKRQYEKSTKLTRKLKATTTIIDKAVESLQQFQASIQQVADGSHRLQCIMPISIQQVADGSHRLQCNTPNITNKPQQYDENLDAIELRKINPLLLMKSKLTVDGINQISHKKYNKEDVL